MSIYDNSSTLHYHKIHTSEKSTTDISQLEKKELYETKYTGCLNRPYHFIFFIRCLQQTLTVLFLNAFSDMYLDKFVQFT